MLRGQSVAVESGVEGGPVLCGVSVKVELELDSGSMEWSVWIFVVRSLTRMAR